MGAASCFETPTFGGLLSMRPRKTRLLLRDVALRVAPQHEAEETSSLGLLAYHDVYGVPVGGCDGGGTAIKPLREYQGYRATMRRIAAVRSGVVLRDPPLKTCARGAGVIAAVDAT